MIKSNLDWQKYLLFAGMAAVAFMLLLRYSDFRDQKQVAIDTTTVSVTNTSTTVSAIQASAPEAFADGDMIPQSPDEESLVSAAIAPQQQMIHIVTDSLDVLIDRQGGDIIKVALPRHFAKIDTPDQPFVLLNRTENTTYIAQSGLIGVNGTDKPGQRPVFTSSNTEYRMLDGEDTLEVILSTQQGDVAIEKVFTFKRGDYLIDLQYRLNNQSNDTWKGNMYAQILRDTHAPATDAGIGMQPFLGAALTTKEENYKKFNFDDIEEQKFKETVNGGWVAMVQHYFISAWVPDQGQENRFTLQKFKTNDLYSFGFTTPRLTINSGEQGVIGASFYAGPKDVYRLEEIAPYLDLTVDYSFLWWIAKPLSHFLYFIYDFVGNWGLSIIFLTMAVKAVFYKLSATSYRSMANMRKIQPQMVRMKELYGSDRSRMSQEMMKLYKKEKVNPMGGCLPVLVQMPVFLALYWVLMESVELRHTSFLWLGDLSVKDPYFILPLLMGLTMFIQMKLNPTPPDPTQAKIMQIMPVAFTFLFMWFPAGLVLYWVTNNTLSICQQYVITRNIENAGKDKQDKLPSV
tara:strand:+ start:213 stop:1928 length:1716 start_codon:yes stop_codon:yes gene_type:complete